VVVTDRNASANYVRFQAAIDGLDFIDGELVFAADWTHPDRYEYWHRKSARCAEVLVPRAVAPAMIEGAYVCRHGRANLRAVAPSLYYEIDDDLFFCN
jgi:hypothetical protein